MSDKSHEWSLLNWINLWLMMFLYTQAYSQLQKKCLKVSSFDVINLTKVFDWRKNFFECENKLIWKNEKMNFYPYIFIFFLFSFWIKDIILEIIFLRLELEASKLNWANPVLNTIGVNSLRLGGFQFLKLTLASKPSKIKVYI